MVLTRCLYVNDDSETEVQWQMKSGNYPISIRVVNKTEVEKWLLGLIQLNHDSSHLIVILWFLIPSVAV